MKPIEIRPNVFFVGAVDWDRRLFDNLVPLPDGTSYNAFLIKGSEKTALVDTVDFHMSDVLFEFLKDVDHIDYIIAHHGEQDHSGTLPKILKKYPEAKVYLSPKAKGIFMDLLHLPEETFVTVEDKETLSLGDKTIEFIHAPWVHWPETMSTYLIEDKILFSCDFFGSHRATSSIFVKDEYKVIEDAKRYYAEIMMPFRTNIPKYLGRIRELEPQITAPSHGPAHRDPEFILDAYEKWTSGEPERVVLIPYVSMHNSTKMMVDYLVDQLVGLGINSITMNLAQCELGQFAMNVVEAAAVIFATPTFLVGPHPFVLQAAVIMGLMKPKTRIVGFMGSYGWGSKAPQMIMDQLKMVKAEFLEPIMVKGMPTDETLDAINELALRIKELMDA